MMDGHTDGSMHGWMNEQIDECDGDAKTNNENDNVNENPANSLSEAEYAYDSFSRGTNPLLIRYF